MTPVEILILEWLQSNPSRLHEVSLGLLLILLLCVGALVALSLVPPVSVPDKRRIDRE